MVISVVPENEVQLSHLREMEMGAIDFWSSPTFVGKDVDIRVSPES